MVCVCVCLTSRSSGVTSSIEDFDCEPPATQLKDEGQTTGCSLKIMRWGCSGFPLTFFCKIKRLQAEHPGGSSWRKQVQHLPFHLTSWRSDEVSRCGQELENLFPEDECHLELSHGGYFNITSQNCCCGKHVGQMEARWSGLDYQPLSLLCCGLFWFPQPKLTRPSQAAVLTK